MTVSSAKRYKRRHKSISALLSSNPTLILGFDLTFLVVVSTSLKNAAAIAIELTIVHFVTMVVSLLFLRRLDGWLRILAVTFVSTATMIGARELLILLFPDILNYLGMYIYLMAVGGLTTAHALGLGPRTRLWPVLTREFLHVLGFVLAMFALSAAREFFGSGTLWGIPLGWRYKLGGLAIPFSGFLMVGFLIACYRSIGRRITLFLLRENYRRQSRYVILDAK